MHHSADLAFPQGLEHVYSTFNIGAQISGRSHIGVGNTNKRRQMENNIMAVKVTLHEADVLNIALYNRQHLALFCRQELDIPPIAARTVMQHSRNLGAIPNQHRA
jgi:hypothetical protein